MIGSTVITRPSVSSGPSQATFGHVGLLVDPAADAVAGELGADAEAAALDLGLDGGADRADVVAGGRGLEAAPERGLRRRRRAAARAGATRPTGDRAAGVGVEAVELGGDVELDQLALAQPARAGDAVDALVVDGDADGAGEVVVEPRAGAGAVAGEDLRGDLVELAGGHARADAAGQLAQRLGDDAARGAQRGQLIRVVDGHPVILTDLMSSATFTRPSRGDVLELTIDSLAHGGNGVARLEGYVVFVAGGVPGDRVRAVVGKAKKAYAEARAIEIVEPSPDRVVPGSTRSGDGSTISTARASAYAFLALPTTALTRSPGNAAGHEHDVALFARDAVAAVGERVDREFEHVAARRPSESGRRHGSVRMTGCPSTP